MRLGEFEPPEYLYEAIHTATAHDLCPRLQRHNSQRCFSFEHILDVEVRTSGCIAPDIRPQYRQKEQTNRIGGHTEIISN